MPKYHVRGIVKITTFTARIIESSCENSAIDKFEEITSILIGDPNAHVDFLQIKIDEIKYVNDKGKE